MRHHAYPPNPLLPPGEYNATVTGAQDKISNNGNEMLELVLIVYGPESRRVTVFDYLVATEASSWKIAKFCVAAGIEYEAGIIRPEHCKDAYVRVNVGIEKQVGFPEKNKILDYLGPAQGVEAQAIAAKDENPDESIPF